MDSNPPRKGASNIRDDPGLLRGVLASDSEVKFYPDDECLLCLREGRTNDERCWHKHWETTDQGGNTERRGGAGVR